MTHITVPWLSVVNTVHVLTVAIRTHTAGDATVPVLVPSIWDYLPELCRLRHNSMVHKYWCILYTCNVYSECRSW